MIVSNSIEESQILFEKIYELLHINEGEWEPMMNLLSWYHDNKWYTVLFLRAKHRPSHYFAEGDSNLLLSPASVDLGGLFITPLEKDFKKISDREILEICDEIMVPQKDIDELILKLKNLNNISQIIKKYEKIDKDILKKINQNKNENIVYDYDVYEN